jgi:hypothetical protein
MSGKVLYVSRLETKLTRLLDKGIIDKKEFDKLNIRDFKRRDRTDYDDMPKPHYFIWSDWLKKIEDSDIDELTKLLSVNYIV